MLTGSPSLPFFSPPPPPYPSRARLICALLVLIRPHYTRREPGTGQCSTYYKVQPMFVSSTQRRHWVILRSWVCHLNYRPICLLTYSKHWVINCFHECVIPITVEPRFNEILVITNTIHKPQRKICLDITNKCHHVIKDKCQTDQQG